VFSAKLTCTRVCVGVAMQLLDVASESKYSSLFKLPDSTAVFALAISALPTHIRTIVAISIQTGQMNTISQYMRNDSMEKSSKLLQLRYTGIDFKSSVKETNYLKREE